MCRYGKSMPVRKTVYLDHSASTPVDPRVLEVMLPYFSEVYGNPSSSHQFGRRAERAIEQARATIAGILNCRPDEIVFTGSGSESDNLAVRGAAWLARQQGKGHHLVTTSVEHSAVGRTVAQMAQVMGFEQTVLPVDKYGRVNPDDFAAALRPETTVASVMYANNEAGTLQPIAELAAIARKNGVVFHTDAVQAAGQLSLDVQALSVDMLSISAHKFYGPKGAGALYIREGIEILPEQTGGSHEHGRRAGTQNTPLIIGMAKALELAYAEREQRVAHYDRMRQMLIEGILSRVPDAALTGHPEKRLPSHASFVFRGIEANQLLMHLDMHGVAASSASACKTGNPEPSEVLLAMGYDREAALSSLRLTVGKDTTEDDVCYAIEVVAEVAAVLRKLQKSSLIVS